MRAADSPALLPLPAKTAARTGGTAGPASLARYVRRELFVLAMALLPGMAWAQKAPPGMTQLALEVIINEHSTKLIGEIHRGADGRLFATREELRALGIAAPGKGADKEMVGFDALPGASIRYAEAEQKLHLELPDALRLARTYDLTAAGREEAPTMAVSRDVGLVVNYNAYGTAARGYTGASRPYTTGTVTLESRAYSPYGVLQSGAVLGTSLVRQGALRLETSYVFADRDSATNATLGDAISGGLAWSRPVRFGGAQLARAFGLRTDLVTAPLPSVSGSAAVPSTVDVYIDTMRIASQEVGAGPYRIANLPVSGESGTARVVVRDITGKESVTALPFFSAARLLAPGMLDFSLDAGYARRNYALESFNYAKAPMGQASLRYGLSDAVTLEAHGEGMQRLGMAGGGATVGAGRLGTLTLAGAGSWHAGRWGGMGYASWQASYKGYFLGLSSQRTVSRFTDVASATAITTPTAALSSNFLDSGFFVLNRSAKVPRALDRIALGKTIEGINATISASVMNVERARGDVSRLASATWSQTFYKKYNTFVTLYSDFGTKRQTGLVAGLSFAFNDDILVNASGGGGRGERSASLDISRPVGNNEYDYGWRLGTLEGSGAVRVAQASAKTPYGRASAGLRQDGGSLGGFGEVDGAAILTPAGVFASRRINDAFAIVDVGVPGVEVLHENRPVGRSDFSGKVLVSEVNSFQRTKIAIAPESLPGDAHASQTEAEIMPNFRGSATLTIKTMSARDSARVEIRDGKGEPLTPGTRLKHEESGASFTIGYGGATFLPQIGETNTLTIALDARRCTLTFTRADRKGPQGLVGPLTCTLQ